MFDLNIFLSALPGMLIFASLGWVSSLILKNVTIVDSMWGIFFLIASLNYFHYSPQSQRSILTLTLIILWSLRLAIYLTWRNFGKAEDHRYRAIRINNSPGFSIKSIYIIFGLQLLLAWIISLPLLAAINSESPIGIFDVLGVLLFMNGLFWESVSDIQLAIFKSDPKKKGKVLRSGLWKYTRHPNYFGEACLWSGFYLVALSAGGWWSFPGIFLMIFLLLKVSGVKLLEKDIAERRPEYLEYMQNTSAFLPWRPKR